MTNSRIRQLLGALWFFGHAVLAAQSPPQRPRLVVLLAIDQMAAWVHDAAAPWFRDDGGFRRLARDGVTFAQCAYEHACTETGPGHATIGTGAPASRHGISSNEWWDRQLGKKVYCVADDAGVPLEALPEAKDRGPGRLLAPTLASGVKAHLAGSRVASVAWKDRSAILMGGPDADLVLWFEKTTGRLVTNTLWAEAVPAWLAAFDATPPLDAFFGATWDRFGPAEAYAGLEDDRRFEWPHPNGAKQHTLPQPLTGGKAAPEAAFYDQVYTSPWGNTAVRLAAEATLRGMQLGADDVPDLLCVSFSSTDVIGHWFGADSVEARDALLRLDAELATLFATFDREVGTGRWAVFVTADHGVAPMPETALAAGVHAGRGPIDAWIKSAVERALVERYGERPEGQRYVEHVGDNAVYLAGAERSRHGVELARTAAAAAGKVRGVMTAYATDDVRHDGASDDPVRRSLAHAIVEGRTGEVQVVMQPYWLNGATPASHGTPHPYDREVVAFAMGPRLPAGAVCEVPITPGFGAVLLARLLGLPKPTAAHEEVPAGLLGWR